MNVGDMINYEEAATLPFGSAVSYKGETWVLFAPSGEGHNLPRWRTATREVAGRMGLCGLGGGNLLRVIRIERLGPPGIEAAAPCVATITLSLAEYSTLAGTGMVTLADGTVLRIEVKP